MRNDVRNPQTRRLRYRRVAHERLVVSRGVGARRAALVRKQKKKKNPETRSRETKTDDETGVSRSAESVWVRVRKPFGAIHDYLRRTPVGRAAQSFLGGPNDCVLHRTVQVRVSSSATCCCCSDVPTSTVLTVFFFFLRSATVFTIKKSFRV